MFTIFRHLDDMELREEFEGITAEIERLRQRQYLLQQEIVSRQNDEHLSPPAGKTTITGGKVLDLKKFFKRKKGKE